MHTLRSNNCALGLKSQFAIITCSHLKPVLRYRMIRAYLASSVSATMLEMIGVAALVPSKYEEHCAYVVAVVYGDKEHVLLMYAINCASDYWRFHFKSEAHTSSFPYHFR